MGDQDGKIHRASDWILFWKNGVAYPIVINKVTGQKHSRTRQRTHHNFLMSSSLSRFNEEKPGQQQDSTDTVQRSVDRRKHRIVNFS